MLAVSLGTVLSLVILIVPSSSKATLTPAGIVAAAPVLSTIDVAASESFPCGTRTSTTFPVAASVSFTTASFGMIEVSIVVYAEIEPVVRFALLPFTHASDI